MGAGGVISERSNQFPAVKTCEAARIRTAKVEEKCPRAYASVTSESAIGAKGGGGGGGQYFSPLCSVHRDHAVMQPGGGGTDDDVEEETDALTAPVLALLVDPPSGEWGDGEPSKNTPSSGALTLLW